MDNSTTTATAGTALNALAAGRVLLAVAALAAPTQFARLVGVRPSAELTYMTRIYGGRALAMGLAYLTGGQTERRRWKRFGLMVDTTDTITGIAHVVRRDLPLRAALSMVLLTGSYAAIGAADVASEHHVRRRLSVTNVAA